MDSDKKKVAKILRAMKRQAKAPLNAAKKTEYIEKKAKEMSKKMTWPEKEFKKLMKEIGVKIIPQKIVMGKIYDFYEPNSNTLFEVDGNYFHGDRTIYEELSPMQRRNTKNDEYKNVLAIGLGYKLERIWESDLKNNYKDVRNRMKIYFKL
jgi:very-short-patch-repair endonuclease